MFIQSIRVPFQTACKCKRRRKGVCIAFFLHFPFRHLLYFVVHVTHIYVVFLLL